MVFFFVQIDFEIFLKKVFDESHNVLYTNELASIFFITKYSCRYSSIFLHLLHFLCNKSLN